MREFSWKKVAVHFRFVLINTAALARWLQAHETENRLNGFTFFYPPDHRAKAAVLMKMIERSNRSSH